MTDPNDDETEPVTEDEPEEYTDQPWQAPYAWEIVTGKVEVPDAVHAAAVKWLVGAFSILE